MREWKIFAMIADFFAFFYAGFLLDLSQSALKAAVIGGVEEWGQRASVFDHYLYVEPIDSRSRRRCHCGCNKRATHRGMANGICLSQGCELSMMRWAKRWTCRKSAPSAIASRTKENRKMPHKVMLFFLIALRLRPGARRHCLQKRNAADRIRLARGNRDLLLIDLETERAFEL